MGGITYEEMVTFKKAFDCFVSWFLINVSDEVKDITPYSFKIIEDKLGDIGICFEIDDDKTRKIRQQNRLLLYHAKFLGEEKKKKLKENKDAISEEILIKLDEVLRNQNKEEKNWMR